MSDCDWENRVWAGLPWDALTALGAVAIAWPLAAIAANDPRRPRHPQTPTDPEPGDPIGE